VVEADCAYSCEKEGNNLAGYPLKGALSGSLYFHITAVKMRGLADLFEVCTSVRTRRPSIISS